MPEQRVSAHVHTTAEQYHRMAVSEDNPWDALLIERLLAVSHDRPPGGRLLDIGTGTGVVLLKLAGIPRFADVELIGSDYFEDMVIQARRRAAEAGLEGRIRFDREDAHHLSYPGEWATWVISRSTIHHWARPVQALKEIFRVLAPGGAALIHDIRRDPPPAAIARFNEMRGAAGVAPSLLDDKYTPAEARRMCEEAGIASSAQVFAPDDGPGALGYEILVEKER